MNDTFLSLPLTALRESPFNPRKSFPEAELQELADSIAAQGVMQPIVARCIGQAQGEAFFEYEIIFGHRRFRAARLAGLDRVPVITRELTDEQAAISQVHENTKRADVNAIEEADSFAHLSKAHKLKPEAIAKAVGKSKSYVYGRMKLTKAAPEVRTAVLEQGLSPEIALDLARLPDHNMQRSALKRMRESYKETPENPIVWLSVRAAATQLNGLFDTDLDDAPFDLADAKLAARAGACTTCPRRAGNDPDLAERLAASICTDQSCYAVKLRAHNYARIAELRAQGHTVIEGAAAKELMAHGYTNLRTKGLVPTHSEAWLEAGETEDKVVGVSWADALQRHPDVCKQTIVLNPHTDELVHHITDDGAEALLKAAGRGVSRFDESGPTRTPFFAARAHEEDAQDDRPPEVRAVVDYRVWERVQVACCAVAAKAGQRTKAELVMIARVLTCNRDDLPAGVLAAMGWAEEFDADANPEAADKTEEELVKAKLPGLSPDELSRYIVLMAISDAPGTYGQEGIAEKLAIAEAYGIDVCKVAGADEKTHDAGQASADLFDEAH
jgi:ParB/RepB/Spo0J family partition protein